MKTLDSVALRTTRRLSIQPDPSKSPLYFESEHDRPCATSLMQGLDESVLQATNMNTDTGQYVFQQCDAAALQHAGSSSNLKDNFWTYVCGYPFLNTEQFTGRARVGNQGEWAVWVSQTARQTMPAVRNQLRLMPVIFKGKPIAERRLSFRREVFVLRDARATES